MPVIGFLNPRSPSKGELVAAAFRRGLQDAGYVEGRNVAVEYRWAEDRYDRLTALAADLAARRVAVMRGRRRRLGRRQCLLFELSLRRCRQHPLSGATA